MKILWTEARKWLEWAVGLTEPSMPAHRPPHATLGQTEQPGWPQWLSCGRIRRADSLSPTKPLACRRPAIQNSCLALPLLYFHLPPPPPLPLTSPPEAPPSLPAWDLTPNPLTPTSDSRFTSRAYDRRPTRQPQARPSAHDQFFKRSEQPGITRYTRDAFPPAHLRHAGRRPGLPF